MKERAAGQIEGLIAGRSLYSKAGKLAHEMGVENLMPESHYRSAYGFWHTDPMWHSSIAFQIWNFLKQ
jgi:hypothetical protein